MPSLVPFSDLLGAIFEPFKATTTLRVGLPTRSLISLKKFVRNNLLKNFTFGQKTSM